MEGGKPENPEKNPRSRDESQQQTQPTCDAKSGNPTRDTLVGGAIPALQQVPCSPASCSKETSETISDSAECYAGL